jgi:predicted phosphate transport protein (TIGR00153 family)
VLEHRGDELIHEIFTRLNQTFITPIDPEDIHNISAALDNVLDGMEDTAHRLVSYHIDPIPPAMITLAEIVASCAKALKSAFEALEQEGPIMEHCIEINRLENEADLIGRSAVADLFNKEKDPITLIKLKEVYEFFENTIDSCEDVADVSAERGGQEQLACPRSTGRPDHRDRAGVRLHQRLPRRRQFHRHHCGHARVDAVSGGVVGGVFQFRRGLSFRHGGGQDGGQGIRGTWNW